MALKQTLKYKSYTKQYEDFKLQLKSLQLEVVGTVPSQQEGPGFGTQLGQDLSVMFPACLCGFPPPVQRHAG